MGTKSEVIRFRVSAEEKAEWLELLGDRSLSVWLRELANREVRKLNAANTGLPAKESIITKTEDWPRSEDPTFAHPIVVAGQTCPRDYYHRKGRYCASCKAVIA